MKEDSEAVGGRNLVHLVVEFPPIRLLDDILGTRGSALLQGWLSLVASIERDLWVQPEFNGLCCSQKSSVQVCVSMWLLVLLIHWICQWGMLNGCASKISLKSTLCCHHFNLFGQTLCSSCLVHTRHLWHVPRSSQLLANAMEPNLCQQWYGWD